MLMAFQWLTHIVAIIWLQSINGTNSTFPAYSSQLKRTLSASQLQLSNLASANDAGKLFGWISGLAADHFPLWLVLLTGALFCLVGYGVQFLVLTNHISLSYWPIFFFSVLAGNGICWINTVCYIITIRNFPSDHHIAVGLSTSYVGLSAKIYTVIVNVVAPPTSRSRRAEVFLLLNSVLPLLVVVCTVSSLVRDVSVGKVKKLTRGFFTCMIVISFLTGSFAVVTSFKTVLSANTILAGILGVLLLPLIVPVVAITGSDEEAAMDSNLGSSSVPEAAGVMEEVRPWSMVRRTEFWQYFFIYLFGGTLGLVYTNNLAQISESRGCSGTSLLVSLSSALSYFGRLLPPFIDHIWPRSKQLLTRAGAMGVMMVPMCGAFFLLLSPQDISLYVGTAIIGISTGAIASISGSMTVELFGTNNFGKNHNIVVCNIPIGSFLFGNLAAVFYNRARDGDENCMGHNCYQITFILWGCLCAIGTLVAFILHLRTKRLWSHGTTTQG